MAELPPTIAAVLKQAAPTLQGVSERGRFEAELLLAEVLGRDRSYLHTWPERVLTATEQRHFHQWLQQRQQGVPVAYILGRRDFWRLTLSVNRDTLIPRPETETLLEQALLRLPLAQERRVVDLGCGSGAIALALAQERPQCDIHAVELAEATLAVAKQNGMANGLSVSWHNGSWFEPLRGMSFDMVVANPPYLAADSPWLAAGDLRFEPRGALVAAEAGLADLKHIIDQAGDYLLAGGWLLVEQGYNQAEAVKRLFIDSGFFNIGHAVDLQGIVRVTFGQWQARGESDEWG
ncbi:peptide chain release factor N(5)-glutamine methyltransferase [Ectothiorhodospiraceae bacterium BW-2]|nr:peptide chain release factor N(5)-glutamine methyltransferase [Ectothiorhodospiraceae bacterium BW-2]